MCYNFHGRDDEEVPKDVISVTTHPSVKRVPGAAFDDCGNLETIKLHKGVTSIGYSAFDGCVKLTYINLQETSVATIDE